MPGKENQWSRSQIVRLIQSPQAARGSGCIHMVRRDSMSGYSINIEEKTLSGNNFREVLYTTKRSQLVIMTLQPG
jgi:hypothetical protein